MYHWFNLTEKLVGLNLINVIWSNSARHDLRYVIGFHWFYDSFVRFLFNLISKRTRRFKKLEGSRAFRAMPSINYYITIALYTVTFLYIHFSDTLKAYNYHYQIHSSLWKTTRIQRWNGITGNFSRYCYNAKTHRLKCDTPLYYRFTCQFKKSCRDDRWKSMDTKQQKNANTSFYIMRFYQSSNNFYPFVRNYHRWSAKGEYFSKFSTRYKLWWKISLYHNLSNDNINSKKLILVNQELERFEMTESPV